MPKPDNAPTARDMSIDVEFMLAEIMKKPRKTGIGSYFHADVAGLCRRVLAAEAEVARLAGIIGRLKSQLESIVARME